MLLLLDPNWSAEQEIAGSFKAFPDLFDFSHFALICFLIVPLILFSSVALCLLVNVID